jgi:hypothetical protein
MRRLTGRRERRGWRRAAAAAALLAIALAAPGTSAAGGDYFAAQPKTDEVKITTARSRTPRQRLLIGGLLGGAVASAGIGLYFHLDGRSASEEVTALNPTHEVWTRERQDRYDHAKSARVGAIIGYTGGGLLLAAAAVVFYLTDPGTEVREVGVRVVPAKRPPPAPPSGGALRLQGIDVAPLQGGAMLEAAWRF